MSLLQMLLERLRPKRRKGPQERLRAKHEAIALRLKAMGIPDNVRSLETLTVSGIPWKLSCLSIRTRRYAGERCWGCGHVFKADEEFLEVNKVWKVCLDAQSCKAVLKDFARNVGIVDPSVAEKIRWEKEERT